MLHRNSIVFGRTGPQRNLIDETLARVAEVAYLVSNGKQSTTRNKIQVRWMNPSSNWFKLNSDGSSWGNPSLAGGGGLIQNEKGEWVKGYARAIGITTSVAVELCDFTGWHPSLHCSQAAGSGNRVGCQGGH